MAEIFRTQIDLSRYERQELADLYRMMIRIRRFDENLIRLMQEGKAVYAEPEDAALVPTGEDEDEPVYAAGEDGLLLSGLATGSYVVQVTSDLVTAPPTTVRLREGDTEEVDLAAIFKA